ncbi:MAG TPA: multiheme c-type cytochrome, partial [Gemmataceae bacterium]|nr:multiheme c-type cytochrome [Gemmataceae bacterium]
MDNVQPAGGGGTVAVPPPTRLTDRKGRLYVPAVGPRLKVLLFFIFFCVALLGATGAYLVFIRVMEAVRGQTYTNSFTISIFMAHILVGLALVVPFLVFGCTHLFLARHRKNRPAVRLGVILFVICIILGLSGVVLIQLAGMPQLPTGTVGRGVAYYLHVLLPLAAVAVYVLHRYAGPDIKWRWGAGWGLGVVGFVGVMAVMHFQHPKDWYLQGPKEGEVYFQPSLVRTNNGKFLSAQTMMMDDYCKKCHADIYNDWFHSAHHFSSFNNPAYLFSVRETRKVAMKRDGNTRASRWCAGCHDVVPFLSGAFDDPNYDDVNDPTSQAGITCVACHAITHIDSTVGNGAYTIEEPEQYPFATSSNPVLQWLNNQAIKAKPDFHKKTFLKPFHRTAEFCSTCHKVSVPMALNHYKEFLRGQNHYDTFELSGAHNGSRSFYYPPKGQENCAGCHMPLKASRDFGSHDFDGSGTRKVHNHIFPGGNTGLPWLLALDPKKQDSAEAFRKAAETQADFLRDGQLRIDLFGLREGPDIASPLKAPLRPELPRLKPGKSYLVEVVVRTLKLGHPFTQGTVDSNEVWVDFEARSGGRVIGKSGGMSGPDDTGRVDEWSHFINVLMLDFHGNRINRRNPQDIFTPLYNHQIPPGAGQVVHYRLDVPPDVKGPVELKVRLRYRKFDYEYMSLVYGGDAKVPKLPVIDLCSDHVTLPVEGGPDVAAQESLIKPEDRWQRWNDYGIGLFLTAESDPKKAGLRQAEEAFRELDRLDAKPAHANARLNLARVFVADARYAEAEKALHDARELGAPWWTVAWFSGLVNLQNYHFEEAAADFREILDPAKQPRDRKLDFTRDYVVIDRLGETLFNLAQEHANEPDRRDDYLRQAIEQLERTLQLEPEDLDAHFYLSKCYGWLGQEMPEAAGGEAAKIRGGENVLPDLARAFADRSVARELRLRRAETLAEEITAFGRAPTKPNEPKLPKLLAVRRLCLDVYRNGEDAGLRAAAAHVLGAVHREAHAIYKPDDNAADRAVSIYRGKHPAAAQASYA